MFTHFTPSILPVHAGNTLGAIAGIVGPIVVAAFTEEWTGIWGWRATFFLTAGFGAVSCLTWVLFQSSTVNPVLNTPLPKSF